MRKITLILAVIMLTTIASGMSFGSFVSNNQKTVQGTSAQFYINVMNLGENNLELRIESRNADTGSIRAPSEIVLQPSQTTNNPTQNIDDDEEWLLLDDGKYVKTKKIPVIFVAEEGTGHDFSVDISATPSDTFLNQNGQEYSTAQRVVQSRSYDFTVVTSSSTSNSPPTNEDENSETNNNQQNNNQQSSFQSTASDFVRETVENTRDTLGLGSEDEGTNSDDGTEESGTDQTTENNQESDESSENEDDSDTSATGSFFSQAASNPVTTTLMTGVVISVGYLLMVLL